MLLQSGLIEHMITTIISLTAQFPASQVNKRSTNLIDVHINADKKLEILGIWLRFFRVFQRFTQVYSRKRSKLPTLTHQRDFNSPISRHVPVSHYREVISGAKLSIFHTIFIEFHEFSWDTNCASWKISRDAYCTKYPGSLSVKWIWVHSFFIRIILFSPSLGYS